MGKLNGGETTFSPAAEQELVDRIEQLDGMVVASHETLGGSRKMVECDWCAEDSPLWSLSEFADGDLTKLEEHIKRDTHQGNRLS